MSITNENVLGLLKELNELADMYRLPKVLLDKIGYCMNTHSGVDVFLQYENSKLRFVFELSIPYEVSDFKYLSSEEIFKLLEK
jgi:hypothetical protein